MKTRKQAHEALVRNFVQGRIDRRTFLGRLSALGIAAPMAGLLENVAHAQTPSDTLVIGAPATPTTLDPEYSSSPQDREVDCSTYDRFTQFKIVTDDNGNRVADLSAPPEPLLAESWEISDGGRKYTIKLREGVKSYFGNELTAEDIVWSWDRVFGLDSQGLFPLGVASIRSKEAYRAVSRYVVEITLDVPNPLLMTVQATPVPGAVFLDSTEVKRHVGEGDPWARKWLATNTASFGPYHAMSFTPGATGRVRGESELLPREAGDGAGSLPRDPELRDAAHPAQGGGDRHCRGPRDPGAPKPRRHRRGPDHERQGEPRSDLRREQLVGTVHGQAGAPGRRLRPAGRRHHQHGVLRRPECSSVPGTGAGSVSGLPRILAVSAPQTRRRRWSC